MLRDELQDEFDRDGAESIRSFLLTATDGLKRLKIAWELKPKVRSKVAAEVEVFQEACIAAGLFPSSGGPHGYRSSDN